MQDNRKNIDGELFDRNSDNSSHDDTCDYDSTYGYDDYEEDFSNSRYLALK